MNDRIRQIRLKQRNRQKIAEIVQSHSDILSETTKVNENRKKKKRISDNEISNEESMQCTNVPENTYKNEESPA